MSMAPFLRTVVKIMESDQKAALLHHLIHIWSVIQTQSLAEMG